VASPAAPAPLMTIETSSFLPADKLQRPKQCGQYNSRGSVLVIMENRDAHSVLQHILNFETEWRRDILYHDKTESPGYSLKGVNDPVSIVTFYKKGDATNPGHLIQDDRFTLHNRHPGQDADVAEAKYGGAVRGDARGIPDGGIFTSGIGMFNDIIARLGHPRSINHSQ